MSASPAFPQWRERDGDDLAHGIPGGVSLRAAVDSDLPYLRQLYAGTRETEMAQVPWPPATKRAFLDQQFALQHAHYIGHFPGARFLLLQRGSVPVGRYYLWRDEADLLIVDISLVRQVQGQGIGGALIGRTQVLAVGHGRGVRLSVRRDNEAARRLYERLGFLPVPGGEEAMHLTLRWQAPTGTAPQNISI